MKRLIKNSEVLKDLLGTSYLSFKTRLNALVYCDGTIYEGETHSECIRHFLFDKKQDFSEEELLDIIYNSNNTYEIAFAQEHQMLDGSKCIFIEKDTLENIKDLNSIINSFKKYKSNEPIYISENDAEIITLV